MSVDVRYKPCQDLVYNSIGFSEDAFYQTKEICDQEDLTDPCCNPEYT